MIRNMLDVPIGTHMTAEREHGTPTPGVPAKPENAGRIAMIGRSDRPNPRGIGW